MEQLIYQTSPIVTFATNKFIDVPIILQFDDTPLISVVQEQALGFTTEIPIYHSDGTYLAKVRGTRVFSTADGKIAGLDVSQKAKTTVCTLGKRTVFEIHHQSGDAFRTEAELYTPEGFFIKTVDAPMRELLDASGKVLNLGGGIMSHNTIQGARIGVLIRSDGGCAIGVS